jgi:hypothetical protein
LPFSRACGEKKLAFAGPFLDADGKPNSLVVVRRPTSQQQRPYPSGFMPRPLFESAGNPAVDWTFNAGGTHDDWLVLPSSACRTFSP